MLGTETVYVGEDFVRDDDGKVTRNPAQVAVENCQVQPVSSAELRERGRSGTDDVIDVFLPITTGITSDTVLIVRGEPYAIDGNPLPRLDDEDPELSGYAVQAERRQG